MEAKLNGSPDWPAKTTVDLFVNYSHFNGSDLPPTGAILSIVQNAYDLEHYGSVDVFLTFSEIRLLAHRMLRAIGDRV